MRLFYRIILMIFIFIGGGITVAGEGISGTWHRHEGFDMAYNRVGAHVVSCFGTPQGAYFLIRGRSYAPQDNHTVYREELKHIFKFDKEHPEKGVYPLNEETELSGSRVQIANYSPQANRLVIVYEDGKIDIVDDYGNVVTDEMMKRAFYPLTAKAMSVSFDPDGRRFWLATSYGFMVYDIFSGECEYVRNLGRSVNMINRVGDHIVALAAPLGELQDDPAYSPINSMSKTYYADLFVFDSLEKVKIEQDNYTRVELCEDADIPVGLVNHYDKESHRIKNIQNIFPLTDNTFIVTPFYENNNYGVFAVRIGQNETYSGSFIDHGTYNKDKMGMAWYMTSRNFLEGNSGLIRDGVYTVYGDALTIIRKGVDFNPEDEGAVENFRKLALTRISRKISDLPEAKVDENFGVMHNSPWMA